MMESVAADPALVAYCGLYCGECGKHQSGACPGCRENSKAAWCKVRACNIEKQFSSCAECVVYPNVRDCRKFNNPLSKVIGTVLRSDRAACIAQIKRDGLQGHAEKMVALGRPSIRP